jgi:hypothetical protein
MRADAGVMAERLPVLLGFVSSGYLALDGQDLVPGGVVIPLRLSVRGRRPGVAANQDRRDVIEELLDGADEEVADGDAEFTDEVTRPPVRAAGGGRGLPARVGDRTGRREQSVAWIRP